jgi:hypothetical protein
MGWSGAACSNSCAFCSTINPQMALRSCISMQPLRGRQIGFGSKDVSGGDIEFELTG